MEPNSIKPEPLVEPPPLAVEYPRLAQEQGPRFSQAAQLIMVGGPFYVVGSLCFGMAHITIETMMVVDFAVFGVFLGLVVWQAVVVKRAPVLGMVVCILPILIRAIAFAVGWR